MKADTEPARKTKRSQRSRNLKIFHAMHWIYLSVAILLEVAGTTSMKLSEGFSKPLPSFSIFIFYAFSFTFLTLALKTLPLGMTYAIWAAVGIALITLVGVLWFGEPLNMLKIVSLLLIIIGVAGLHASHEPMH